MHQDKHHRKQLITGNGDDSSTKQKDRHLMQSTFIPTKCNNITLDMTCKRTHTKEKNENRKIRTNVYKESKKKEERRKKKLKRKSGDTVNRTQYA